MSRTSSAVSMSRPSDRDFVIGTHLSWREKGPKRPVVVGWNDTTVSSHPHPAVHNFRPAINQPVDVEWHLLGRSTSSDADPNRLLDSVIQFIQLGQLVYRGEAHLAQTASHRSIPDHIVSPQQHPLPHIN